ncbi:hypothetical protein QBC46DRAFT_28301 [Diplogelasinospora grovesii]|uniref:E3 ubiquitin-protein ligase UBR1-like winged-helix domain-containing protein n=1 Tax=Diplogelasinospora grovesii TaxID=303347 RepID=A0AAN6NEK7_9PEZI|nr:hypothetical protein QBC46DRAFT_28301 [Diplogelasinospora grovesii]
MALDIPESGLLLESSEMVMEGLPTQAFALSLSDETIEQMIRCVENGGEIELFLGSKPSFLIGSEEVKIANPEDSIEYDLYHSDSATPEAITRLPNPTMSILQAPRRKPKVTQAAKQAKPSHGSSGEEVDDAIANLKNSYAKVEAEKLENSAKIVDSVVTTKGGKLKAGKTKTLLKAQPNATSRSSLPASPALSGVGSPSLGPISNPAQERAKQQRFPIIHELAVRDMTFIELKDKYDGDDKEFMRILEKVAGFGDNQQKWTLKKLYWKELDVFQYDYASEEDRQTAIDNAIRQYDKSRLGASDPLWQKLLPESERGKGTCLSKLQKAIIEKQSAPKINLHKADGASVSGDSERDDSTSSGAKKGTVGGEPMSRSSSKTSQTGKKKLSASELQAKRLLSNTKRSGAGSTTTSAKASPKVSPSKPTAKAATGANATAGKKGRGALSKEIITDSDSDSEEVPLANSIPKSKAAAAAAAPKPVERATAPEKLPKATEKQRKESPAPAPVKPKPAPSSKPSLKEREKQREKERELAREKEREKERDTIRAEVVAKPVKKAVGTGLSNKRRRDDDVEDGDTSSSSGAPLSKRPRPVGTIGAVSKATQPLPAAKSIKPRADSNASQNSRATTNSGVSVNKSKGTSPVKSSPLASSPPTNASDLDEQRHRQPSSLARQREREREREREIDRETMVSSASSRAGSSSSSVGELPSSGGSGSRKRPAEDSGSSSGKSNSNGNGNGNGNKRQRLSQEILNKAHTFKQCYTRYEKLHKEISALNDPDPDKVSDLIEMRKRLSEMKEEIYNKAPVDH